jgi:hypothetical protein
MVPLRYRLVNHGAPELLNPDEDSPASVALKIKSFNVVKPFSNSESDCFQDKNKGIVPL